MIVTTPFTRTELASIVQSHAYSLEIILHADMPHLFPERVVAKYRDAVSRLVVAAGDMAMFGRCLDNAPKGSTVHRAAGKVRKGTGAATHKRKHVRTRPLPDAAAEERYHGDVDADGSLA